MRYYESIYERYLSKIPKECAKVDPRLLVARHENRRVCNQYEWSEQDIEQIRAMRAKGIPFRAIAEHFKASQTVVQRLALRHKMLSPTNRINNRPPESMCPSTE